MQSLVKLYHIEARPPSLGDNTGDLDRLQKVLSGYFRGLHPVVPISRLGLVAEAFRSSGFKGHALVIHYPGGPQLVDFLEQAPDMLLGMALDLGTTHLEASLLDLLSGKVLGQSAVENRQLEFGADILTRIHFAATKVGRQTGLDLLHERVMESIQVLALKLTEPIKMKPAQIMALCVSGNTAMTHFFLKLDPYHLCREPYIPVVNSPDSFAASALDLDLHPAAIVSVMPSIGSYFGGDLISGILASNLDRQEETSMLIDVGTNAEVVVGNRDWLIACAGAAGPALEGGVARMGMRAEPGAIEHCTLDPDSGRIDYQTIGGLPARGICGSGVIDLVAGLYLARIIDIRGKFRSGQPQAEGRLFLQGDTLAYVVVPEEETDLGEPILLSQVDIDALMRSKAAMYSILATITNQVGVSFHDLHRIYVAGAFGKHISPRQAIVLGMLPDLPLEVYQPLGNSSLAGAELMLTDESIRERCRKVVSKVTYVELNVNQEFMIRFSGSRFIPHTDHALFPSVPFYGDS
ncbi:MAG: [Fe-S]-binding protein [Nitrospira bacterium SG8_35_1]|nr:MAG: [Fe-S]-binding protein [Nitrospira bacterium SG8_35_1]